MDKRIYKTKVAIKNAVYELLKNKKLSQITISEICEKAMVNRNTFYAHYSNPIDVIDEIADFLVSQCVAILKGSNNGALIIEKTCEFMENNHQDFSVLLNPNSESMIMNKMFKASMLRQQSIMIKENSSLSPSYQQLLSEFVIEGNRTVLTNWFNNGMKEDPKELSEFLIKISNYGTKSFILSD